MTHVAGLYHFREFARCAFRRRIGHFQPRLAFEYLARTRHEFGRCHEKTIGRSEEHTSELQSLMRISYAVFCLKKKKRTQKLRQTDIEKKINNESEYRIIRKGQVRDDT